MRSSDLPLRVWTMHHSPVLQYDAGYYEYSPGLWLPGRLTAQDAMGTLSRRAVDAASRITLRNSDILLASYPKSGKSVVRACRVHMGLSGFVLVQHQLLTWVQIFSGP